jgi:hypothetical protein
MLARRLSALGLPAATKPGVLGLARGLRRATRRRRDLATCARGDLAPEWRRLAPARARDPGAERPAFGAPADAVGLGLDPPQPASASVVAASAIAIRRRRDWIMV